MNLELIIVIVAAVAVVGLVGLSLSIREMPGDRPRVDQAHPRTSLAGAKDVVDRSIGMFLIRRVSGRPTTRRRGPDAPTTPLTKDEVAYRTGVPDAPIPAEIDVPVPPAKGRRAATAAAARAGATQASGTRNGAGRTTSPRTPARSATAPMAVSRVSATDRSGRRVVAGPAGPAAPRERLVRDAGIALVGLAAFALVAIFAFPGSAGQPTGSRLAVVQASESDATTPDPTDTPPIESATASTSSDETPLPSDAATPAPTPEPIPPATGSPAPTPTQPDAQADRHADPDAEADPHADAEPHGDAETHPDPDADPDADADPHGDPDAEAHGIADAHPDADPLLQLYGERPDAVLQRVGIDERNQLSVVVRRWRHRHRRSAIAHVSGQARPVRTSPSRCRTPRAPTRTTQTYSVTP